MKKFKIGVWQEVSGYMLVAAKNEKEAKQKALNIISKISIKPDNTDITHREHYLV